MTEQDKPWTVKWSIPIWGTEERGFDTAKQAFDFLFYTVIPNARMTAKSVRSPRSEEFFKSPQEAKNACTRFYRWFEKRKTIKVDSEVGIALSEAP